MTSGWRVEGARDPGPRRWAMHDGALERHLRAERSSALGSGLLAMVAVVLVSGLTAFAFARALPQEPPAPPLEVGETGEPGGAGTVAPPGEPDPTVSPDPDEDSEEPEEDAEEDEEEAAREAAEEYCDELAEDGLSYPDALDVIATEGTYQLAMGAGELACEGSFDEDEIEDYHDLTPPEDLEGGLSCGALRSRGYTYADALEYWVEQGSPYRMQVSSGVPCRSSYPSDIVDAYFD